MLSSRDGHDGAVFRWQRAMPRMRASPAHTTPSRPQTVTSKAMPSTFGPEVIGVVLDDLPAGSRQRGPIVLQHVDVFGPGERPVATADATSATAAEVPDMLDRLERPLGLACRACARPRPCLGRRIAVWRRTARV